jgi:hypothetical protein
MHCAITISWNASFIIVTATRVLMGIGDAAGIITGAIRMATFVDAACAVDTVFRALQLGWCVAA